MMTKASGAHRTNRLSSAHVRAALGKPGRHMDGNGLFLAVDPSGAARWIQRLTVQGRRRDIGIGPLAVVTLSEAREIAIRNRKTAHSGGDPITERDEQRARATAPTFKAAAQECFEAREGTWRNEKHRAQWLASLEAYAFPRIGGKQVNQITAGDVLETLMPIWTTKSATARRVRQRIGLVLDWSKAKGWRQQGSPTPELGKALPAQKAQVRHQPSMPYAELPYFLDEVRESDALDATKAAMEVLILSACRTTEVIRAQWPEFDLEKALWTVPADRMKAGRAHAVPLSSRAVAILRERHRAHSGNGYFVFEAKPGKPLSNMALLALMRRFKLATVPHGFRSSFRDWAAERTNAPREVAEAALAHAVGNKVEAAYRRSDLLEKRRRLMSQWAAHCAGGGGVVHLATRRSGAT